jgi:hypothetical protein
MSEAVYNSVVVLNNGQYDYLVDHAIRDVWCNPEQDNQHIVSPHRLTSSEGVFNSARVMKREIKLPSSREKYHLFQIGQLHPLILGMFEYSPAWVREQWISAKDAIIDLNFIMDIYNIQGIQLPRFEVFYMFTNDRNFIVAIKENRTIPINYKTDDIFIRVYTNAYFDSVRAHSSVETTYCYGAKISSSDQLLNVQYLYESYATKSGLVYGFVNGRLVDKIDMTTTKIGDTIDFVYDSSVLRTVTFRIGDLPYFESILDNKRKYLLHYVSQTNDTIDYHDDMDIFIADEYLPGRYNGVYYHRNNPNACRMVTHRDYSIVVDYFMQYAAQLQLMAGDRILDFENLKVRLHIRKSGYYRPLVFENNRIQELYKLSSTQVLNAMCGVNAGVSVWRAENLENSAYTQLMRSNAVNISRALVEEAYGYNAVSKILGDTPKLTYDYSGRKQVEVPHGLESNSMAYEYDSDGLLIGFYRHVAGTVYNCLNNNCALVEMISGIGDYYPDVRFGTDNIPIPTSAEYRVYRCHYQEDGTLDNDWKDVTDSAFYTVQNNTIVWSPTDYNSYIMVRTNAKFLAYEQHIFPVGGTLEITLTEMETRNHIVDNHILPVPMGELDVFLNGRSLIEGLDYFVNFPRLVIVNKAWLRHPLSTTAQKVHVRFTGFCKTELVRETPEDFGWVQYGLLSKNNKFDIRDDRVLRIVMNGQLYDWSQLKFSETDLGLGILNARNGYPYQIRDIVVPMRQYTDSDTYAYRAESKVIDRSVSDYLTTLLPEPSYANPSAIPRRYEVVSPFIARIIYELRVGQIPLATVSKSLTDNEVIEICQPYEFMLAFDPTQPDVGADANYVIIHPHIEYSAVPLKFYQYRFLQQVVKLYSNGLVDLSSFIILESAA